MKNNIATQVCTFLISACFLSSCSTSTTNFSGVGAGILQASGTHSLTESEVQGVKSLRFEVRPGDRWNDGFKDSSRSEISFGKSYDSNGVRYRYKFDVLVPSKVNGKINGTSGQVIIAQWHQGRGGDPKYMLGWPTAALYFSEGSLWISVVLVEEGAGMPKQVAIKRIDDFQFDRWNSFEFSTVWSQGSDGHFYALMNGKSILNYDGPNGYPSGMNWFKFGIYRINDVYAPTTVVYFKDVRRD
ncbi:heparin lyase I family protein [Azospirillum sp. B2RO_4]|uniref:heparin lyase I family protein n=1 Tax=Azospirillum sp. B2RO_4 TaxID=3027796 RepID=UPI003DA91194